MDPRPETDEFSFIVVFSEDRICEVGYFPDIVGYRKIYGNCPLNDIGVGTVENNVNDCQKRCEVEPTCVAFVFENKEVLYLFGGSGFDTTCYLKSVCDEENLSYKNPGVYIYFKGLVKKGSNSQFI